ncbi:hypothetical protein CP500_017705, partial [Tychonema bourrellyi FEM_GT703]
SLLPPHSVYVPVGGAECGLQRQPEPQVRESPAAPASPRGTINAIILTLILKRLDTTPQETTDAWVK